LHNGTRTGVVVVGLAPVDRGGGGERHHAGLGINRSAWEPEAFHVPRRLGHSAGPDPVLGVRHDIGGEHDGVDKLHVFGLRKPKVLTLEQKPKRIGRWHHAGDALGSAGTGKQANLDFRQSHARVRALACDPVMTR